LYDSTYSSDCLLSQNSAPAPSAGAVTQQAVALRITGDYAAFYNCGFYGSQDTLNDDMGRHYYKNCEIVGSIDFIFGDAQSLYKVRRRAPCPHIYIQVVQGSANSKTHP